MGGFLAPDLPLRRPEIMAIDLGLRLESPSF